ncbi:Uncharacterized protein HZ326_3047 [Fusarium oxysporum f. sp. albedinis]|nr:Uncharacterized protein HZ326_3047 [Fusarium oxysporum f. sp. albedinis]
MEDHVTYTNLHYTAYTSNEYMKTQCKILGRDLTKLADGQAKAVGELIFSVSLGFSARSFSLPNLDLFHPIEWHTSFFRPIRR